MNAFNTSFSVEILKIRSAKVFWITILLFAFISCMMGLMMFVQLNPELSGKMGLTGAKASALGEANWDGYFQLLMQGIAGVGLVGIGFVSSWVFGREFTDRTIKDLLALPISRSNLVVAKFILIFFWAFLLSLVYLITGMLIGYGIGLPGWSQDMALHYIGRYLVTNLLMALLITPFCFLASYSRGYMLPLGFAILAVILSNFSGMLGISNYFPWAIPGLYGAANGVEIQSPVAVSYVILVATFLAGLIGTVRWWNRADQG